MSSLNGRHFAHSGVGWGTRYIGQKDADDDDGLKLSTREPICHLRLG